jgi:hypothetical protein
MTREHLLKQIQETKELPEGKQAMKGEIFLFNTRNTELPEGFRTYRLGNEAFDIDGNPLEISTYGLRPAFIHFSEYKRYNEFLMDEYRENRNFKS